jgi:multisite-specific tRNA:(cytosine-C5)-methyltransferase
MIFPLWKSLHSLNLMLPKEDRKALLLRLFNDDTPLVNLAQKPGGGNSMKPLITVESGIEQAETEQRHNSSSEEEVDGGVSIDGTRGEDLAGTLVEDAKAEPSIEQG